MSFANAIAFLNAIENQNKIKVDYLMFLGLKASDIKKYDFDLVRMTCQAGYLDVLKYLVSLGSEVRLMDDHALCVATQNGHLEIVIFLISKGANPKKKFDSPIRIAIKSGHLHIVEYFITSGHYAPNDDGSSNLVDLAYNCNNLHIARFLIKRFLITRSLPSKIINKYYLEIALFHGDLETVKYFVSDGMNIIDIRHNVIDIRDIFTGSGVDNVSGVVNVSGVENCFPISRAAQLGHLELVQYLFEQGADPQSDDNLPVIQACESGNLQVVKFLVEKGADIRAENNEALKRAAQNGRLDVVEYLVSLGADVLTIVLVKLFDVFIDRYDMVDYLLKKGIIVTDEAIRKATHNNYYDVLILVYGAKSDDEISKDMNLTERQRRYLLFYRRVRMRKMLKAQKKIYYWWIPICYSLDHPSGCGHRMAEKNYQAFLNMV